MLFSERMADWQDSDSAAFLLATSIGALPPSASFTKSKWIFWTDNRLGNGLHAALLALVDAGLLEEDDDDRFRWRSQEAASAMPNDVRPGD